MLRCGNGRQITLGEIRDKGLDAYALMGVDRETKYLKRTTSNLAVKLEEVKQVEVEQVEVEQPKEAEILELIPITKPSDRFDVEDYLLYKEYVLERGGKPSIEDYFIAVEYYKNGGR